MNVMSKPERSTRRHVYVFGHYLSKFTNNVSMVLKVSEKLPKMSSSNKCPRQYFGKVKIKKIDLFIILM